MRHSTIDLLRSCYGRYALGAFNVSSLEQVHGLFRGATRAEAPFIVQFTRVMRDYAHPAMLEAMLRGAELIYPKAIFTVHHDHGNEASCVEAINSGNYSSVMIDASHLPFEQNVLSTHRITTSAHTQGISVEAELGQLKGVEDEMSHDIKEAILTDPEKARAFVKATECDSLAVAIGTSHGAYKFSGNQRLHLDRLAEIQKCLPNFPLVLHGGSAVPLDEVRRINEAGGRIDASASGVSEAELAEAIRLGITKVNIGTDGRLIWTRVHREYFRDKPHDFDFMGAGRIYIDEYAAFVEKKCKALGAAGRAREVKESLQLKPQNQALEAEKN